MAATISGINPTSGSSGGGDLVNIYGTNYTPQSVALFGGIPAVTTFISSTNLQVTTPPNSAGVVDVEVSDPAGNSVPVMQDQFLYLDPVVSSLNPFSGPTTGGTTVQISGSFFKGTNQVNFGNVPVTQNIVVNQNGTQITVPAPAHAIQATVDIIVENLNGQSAPSMGSHFLYLAPLPTITGVSPISGPHNASTQVQINGANFLNDGNTTVQFGNVPATNVQVVSSTQITCTAPQQNQPGSVDVKVTTSNGQSIPQPGDRFFYS